MRTWFRNILAIIVAFGFVIGCDEIIVNDISDENVKLLSPADSLVAEAGSLTFWWKEVGHAEKYQLIIVSPSMENPGLLVLDTTISKPQFTQELAEGTYQWCVRAVNSGYETDYACRVLEIEN